MVNDNYIHVDHGGTPMHATSELVNDHILSGSNCPSQ